VQGSLSAMRARFQNIRRILSILKSFNIFIIKNFS